LHIVTGPGSSVFRGTGRIGNEFVYHGLRIACIGLGLTFAWLALGTSVKAIAYGLAGGSGAAACLYLAHNHRRFGLPLRHLLTRILLPGLAVFAAALCLLALWQVSLPATLGRWETLAALGAFGAAHCLAASAAIWLLLDRAEKDHLAAFAGRLAPRLFNWRLA
jgi:hypothetical protein